jgi:hypothetical protein
VRVGVWEIATIWPPRAFVALSDDTRLRLSDILAGNRCIVTSQI